MDVKVSRKERRTYKDGPVEVLLDNACDFFPLFADDPRYINQKIFIGQKKITSTEDRQNTIVDIETLDDDRAERLDRAMFALMKQRGADPVELSDGVQWAEAVLGEVQPSLILQQAQRSVAEEGAGVRAEAYTVKNGNKETLAFKINLTNT